MFKFLNERKLKRETRKALKDGELDDVEKARLVEVANELGLSGASIQVVREQDYARRMQPIISKIVAKRRMSQGELEKIFEISDKLGIEPNLGSDLDKCWILNAQEQGEPFELLAVEPSTFLKDGENCYFCGESIWSQLKLIKTRVGSYGLSTSIRVAKGIRFRVGNVKPAYSQSEEQVPISDGDLIITNKRLIFNGSKKSLNIQLNKILDVQLFVDGIEVAKGSGKNEFFKLSQLDAEFSHLVIDQLLS
jgi:hypothetical protein